MIAPEARAGTTPRGTPLRARGAVLLLLIVAVCALLAACSSCDSDGKAEARQTAVLESPPDVTLHERLDALRKGGKTRVQYQPPEGDEWQLYSDWVADTLRAAQRESRPPRPPEGFVLESMTDESLWILEEHPEHRRGAGAVVLRFGEAQDVIVEAPHTFFDADTLPLSLDAFEQLKARVLIINTAHRANRTEAVGEEAIKERARTGTLLSDVAHEANSFFTGAHVGLTRVLKRAPILQLHGFRDGFVDFEAVISAGDGPLEIAPLTRKLRALLPHERLAAYPLDIQQLGGITNAQANLSRVHGNPFLHLELSRELRTRLLNEPETLAKVVRAIEGALIPGEN